MITNCNKTIKLIMIAAAIITAAILNNSYGKAYDVITEESSEYAENVNDESESSTSSMIDSMTESETDRQESSEDEQEIDDINTDFESEIDTEAETLLREAINEYLGKEAAGLPVTSIEMEDYEIYELIEEIKGHTSLITILMAVNIGCVIALAFLSKWRTNSGD